MVPSLGLGLGMSTFEDAAAFVELSNIHSTNILGNNRCLFLFKKLRMNMS